MAELLTWIFWDGKIAYGQTQEEAMHNYQWRYGTWPLVGPEEKKEE